MIIIWGLRFYYWTTARGTFLCRKCGVDREYRQRKGRRFFHIFWIPLIPLPKTTAHVQCMSCKTRFVPDVLAVPATAQQPAAAQQPFAAQQPAAAAPPQRPQWMDPQPAPAPQQGAVPQPGTGTEPGSTPWWA